MKTSVAIAYLEMNSPEELRPKAPPGEEPGLVRVQTPQPELNRFFYTAVGGDWYWIDRLTWTYAQWLAYLDRPELETWIVTLGGCPAGYFELERQPDDSVEIVYFGLLPAFLDRGLGGWALTEAVRRAWGMGARRVWLHTCTLDHPRAVANYRARGFREYKVETKDEDLPEVPPGPWPGAKK